ncbi:MAG: glycosyltransferase family 2 protein, partial [Anaerolineales bacterium]
MTSLTVSMPAYNEADNIAEMIDRVRDNVGPMVDDLEIVIVDDGSADDTGDIVEEIGAWDPRVRLIRHPANQGYGAAVYHAIWAAEKELIFLTDSDLQFDLQELERFFPRIDGADLVVGYRYDRSDPWYRTLFGSGWSWLVNLLFGYTARDVDCAFKLFKRQVIETIDVDSRGATFSAEFLVRAKRAGFEIVEEPVSHYPRQAGSQTGARPDVILRAFGELFKLRWKMLRG